MNSSGRGLFYRTVFVSVSRNRGKEPNNHESMNPMWDMNLELLNTKRACYYSSQLLTKLIKKDTTTFPSVSSNVSSRTFRDKKCESSDRFKIIWNYRKIYSLPHRKHTATLASRLIG